MSQEISYTPDVAELLDFDKKHIWHPYTSLSSPLNVYPVKSAHGCKLVLDTDSPVDVEVIDAMSSWWCVIHGYNNPELNEALTKQMLKFSHVLLGGFTHKGAVNLVQKLLKVIDEPSLQYCFLADSGSVAVEVALKMALQSNMSGEATKNRTKFLTIKNGYHGDTFGAMSVCDPENSMHHIYNDRLSENIFAQAPSIVDGLPTSQNGFEDHWNAEEVTDLKKQFELHSDEICAVILEPILQGAGGLRPYHPQFLIEVQKLCNQYDVLFIMDEIATGFGRTGEIFAFKHCQKYQDQRGISPSDQIKVVPDILCVGKGLTSGYMTMSAVVVNDKVASRISSPNSPTGGCFMHGPTFMGNALACSVAEKSMDILLRGEWRKQVSAIENQIYRELYQYIKNPDNELIGTVVKRVSVIGAVGIVELYKKTDPEWFQKKFISKGVHIRPFNCLCYIMPPYVITTEELTKVNQVLIEVLHEWKSHINQ
ncbi:HN1_G0012980.mRNA.1.CDS.1 [Saccharomyces cerevisiae]|nr:HN1_G0012980.mRNA.1.CDS.1 [Saccharomyces cerevisiae]CAI4723190.1 BAL_1a_G0046760.mRNA.1.CDS.1 [Saccharomyces cerevisiae]CAI7317109.1 BAL_1a_G0046760.mRNA.1.CDS.1 [Saccharomyces cerevisiae]